MLVMSSQAAGAECGAMPWMNEDERKVSDREVDNREAWFALERAELRVCLRCEKPKTLPAKPVTGVTLAAYELDPYCSTECCKADHGADVKIGSRVLEFDIVAA